MAAKEVEILEPVFYGSFACTGPACGDNCCHTWELDVDKEHYLRYRGEQDPAFQALCAKVLRRRKEGASPQRYATLALVENGRCGFQDEDGGCRIYRLLGPEALCHTCALYPRRKAQLDPGVWELSLSLSCGEAARLALFGGDRLELRRTRRAVNPLDPLDRLPPAGIGKDGAVVPPPPWAGPLRRACMELVQCRLYTVRERILAVGLLLRRADRLLDGGREGQLPALAAQYLASVRAGEFRGFFDRLDYDKKAHLSALRMPVTHLLAGARRPVLRHLWDLLEPWCDRDPGDGEYRAGERALEFLLQTARDRGDPWMEAFPKAVENYFANYLFSGMFPFLYQSEGLTLEQHGILLAEQYALLRLLLAMGPAVEGASGEEGMVKAVVSLARLCQHSDLGRDLLGLTRAVGLDGLAHAAYLLR